MKKLIFLLIIILFFSGCVKKSDKISKNDMELQEKSPFFIDLTQVENYQQIKKTLKINQEEQNYLQDNSFLIKKLGKNDNFSKAYSFLRKNSVPLYLTSDFIFNLTQTNIQKNILNIQNNIQYENLWNLLNNFYTATSKIIETDEYEKQALNLLKSDLAISLSILQPKTDQINTADNNLIIKADEKLFTQEEAKKFIFTPDPDTLNQIKSEIELIKTAQIKEKSELFDYQIDYQKFAMPEVYNNYPKIKNYLITIKWLQNTPFILKNSEVSIEKSQIQTLSAIILSSIISKNDHIKEQRKKINDINSIFWNFPETNLSENYYQIWQKINPEMKKDKDFYLQNFTAFQKEVENYLLSTPLSEPDFRLFPEEKQLDHFIAQQINYPQIQELTIDENQKIPFTAEKIDNKYRKIFSQKMEIFALLGSKKAKQLIEENISLFPNYGENYNKIRAEIENLDQNFWHKNYYQYWLSVLKNYNNKQKNTASSFTYTDNPEWQNKILTTSLGSLFELHKNNINYNSNSSSTGETPLQSISIEPRPDIYQELLNIKQNIEYELQKSNIQIPELKEENSKISEFLQKIIILSDKQIKKIPLTQEETQSLAAVFDNIFFLSSSNIISIDELSSAYSNNVLQHALGYLQFVIIKEELNHKNYFAVGPTYDYSEFKKDKNEKINFKNWQNSLELP